MDDRPSQVIGACSGEEGIAKPYGRKVVSVAAAAGGQTERGGHSGGARVHSSKWQTGIEDFDAIDGPGGVFAAAVAEQRRTKR